MDLSHRLVPVIEAGAVGMAHNRYLSAVATTDVPATNSVSFAAPGVTEVTVILPATVGMTGLMAVFDAPNDVVAAAWLTAGVSTARDFDLQVSRMLPGTEKTFRFTDPITRVDFRAIGAATPVFVEAA